MNITIARKVVSILVVSAMVLSSFAVALVPVTHANQDNQENVNNIHQDNSDDSNNNHQNNGDDNQGDNHGHDSDNGHGHHNHGDDGDNGDDNDGGDNGGNGGGNTPPPYVPGVGILSIVKVIVGGTATANQFSFAVNNGATTTFNIGGENDMTVATGTYSVLETATSTYTASYSNCSGVVVNANATTTCTITNTFVPPAPVVPTCTDSQTLTDGVCVDNPTTPAPQTTSSSGSNGGGGGGGGVIGGPLSIGFVNGNGGNGGNGGGGLVLGASTDIPNGCTLLLTTFMRQGKHNDKAEVTKLQNFLNTELGLSIPVTGFFGPETTAAVNQFQAKYQKNVLDPWTPFGYDNHKPTGYVYKTTQHQINLLACSTLNIPFPQLP